MKKLLIREIEREIEKAYKVNGETDTLVVKMNYEKEKLDYVIELEEEEFEYGDLTLSFWETDMIDDMIYIHFGQKEREKTSYKKYPTHFIGASDIASLTLRSPSEAFVLNFGSDGCYRAYLVDENAEIGNHYKKVFECGFWLKVYDDTDLTFEVSAKRIKVYRAGDFGVIIQTFGEGRVKY